MNLETASPTFGVELPQLPSWTISIYTPQVKRTKGFGGLGAPGASYSSPPSRKRRRQIASTAIDEEDDGAEMMEHRVSAVSSKGGINATFRVPGMIVIPSDDAAHNVTVAQLDLDAVMSWVTVPKISTKAFVKVSFYLLYHIKNKPGISSFRPKSRTLQNTLSCRGRQVCTSTGVLFLGRAYR